MNPTTYDPLAMGCPARAAPGTGDTKPGVEGGPLVGPPPPGRGIGPRPMSTGRVPTRRGGHE